MNTEIIYLIAILASMPIGLIIDNIMNKHLNKINEERIKEIERKKELRKYKD